MMQTIQKPAARLLQGVVHIRTRLPLLSSSPAILSHIQGPRSHISRIIPGAILITTRHRTTAASAEPSTREHEPQNPLPHRPAPHRNPDEPIYHLHFTCKVCRERTAHTVSKQGYHSGTVLIQCPGCKERHLISDHLHVCMPDSSTLEVM